MFNQTNKRH